MTLLCPPPSELTSPQRRCQGLLMLYLPELAVTPELLGQINGVDGNIAQQDIIDTSNEIARYHRLNIITLDDGSYRIEGTHLDRRLCLLHWLRRALRLCPHFISQQFTPSLKIALKQAGIATALYDDTNLHALVKLCSRRLKRNFESRDVQFLRLYLQYCLFMHHTGQTPEFTEPQQQWARVRAEYLTAGEIVRHWQRRIMRLPHDNEHLFLALLFMMLRTPDPGNDSHEQDIRLRLAVSALINRFHALSGMTFSDDQGLSNQLYVHLAQALDRSLFGVGIDNSLPEEIYRLYPKLMRTTREAFTEFETEYGIAFTDEEIGLVAVIFGAWLMQESDLHEKQVLLLTDSDMQREQDIEQQLRELTLLPLNIRYQTLDAFQNDGAPKETTLVISPYVTPLPLFSPPLIHTPTRLGDHQQTRIREILEG